MTDADGRTAPIRLLSWLALSLTGGHRHDVTKLTPVPDAIRAGALETDDAAVDDSHVRALERGIPLCLSSSAREQAATSTDAARKRTAAYLLAARLEQLHEREAARTEAAVPTPGTGRLPELAACPLDGGTARAVVA
ncbi:hypothetical protein OG350_36795 [Streptomyces achromogenes]|uniref:Uncharacterized protein n=1 Tax=Streptomyces achromogenes TaxID=67255 RepID=A0ABZ1L0Q8_STRAH